ncbi:hypothetical protein PRZ48_008019 [Zasmidium cellare]|uniref:Uncharacterized protein n=1 Tax=Zasmidium cellare TaxID=395010 RepID=A0ABR0EF58_ZASCE|nr:hypothetical protein PRZ48_008019 [Zasmidium cellare]
MNKLSHSLFWPPRQYITYPRPDTPDAIVVAALAEMIEALRSQVEVEIGRLIPAAPIAVPHLSQLYETTLEAACDSIGLRCIQVFQRKRFSESLVYHENALLAGLGLGLCYYADGFEAVLTSDVRSAYEVESFAYADFSLGSRMRYSNPKEDFCWEEVRKFISLPLVGTVVQRPTRIVLYGDKGANRKFKQVVNETLQPHFSPDEQPEWIESSIFTAAIGAAELAKRKPYWGLGP